SRYGRLGTASAAATGAPTACVPMVGEKYACASSQNSSSNPGTGVGAPGKPSTITTRSPASAFATARMDAPRRPPGAVSAGGGAMMEVTPVTGGQLAGIAEGTSVARGDTRSRLFVPEAAIAPLGMLLKPPLCPAVTLPSSTRRSASVMLIPGALKPMPAIELG